MSGSRAPEVWTREEAIGQLRAGLLKLSDGEHSMCRVATELGIFCRGFRRWSDGEFLRRWTKVIGRSTHLTRPQLEQLADLWQLTEQLRLRVPLACDAQAKGGACRGWYEFSNADLERCCDDVLGRNVVVHEIAQIAQIAHGPPGTVVPGVDLEAAQGSTLRGTQGGRHLGFQTGGNAP